MKQEKIRKIIKKQADGLAALAEELGKDFDKETIHEFRVAIKTLRAFLRLLQMYNDDSDLKIPKKIRRLYHITGAMRDAQLELEKMKANEFALPLYFNNVRQTLHRQKKEWINHYTKKALNHLKDKLTDAVHSTVPPAALSEFINLKLASVHALSNIKSPADDQVHNIRKLVKDVMYAAKLAKKNWKPAYEQIQRIDVNQLEQIANEIGGYNDNRVILGRLKQFSSRTMGQEEKTALENLCKKETLKLKKKKKEILLLARKPMKGA